MLTDNPVQKVNDDKFGFAPYADILANTVLETEELPFCIGIFAEWGAGKSSLMNMVQDKLVKSKDTKCIWFNPWKYDKKEDLWNALIQTILYSIIEDTKSEKIQNEAKELAKSTLWLMIKKGINFGTAGLVSEGDVDNIVEQFSKTDELHYKYINHFEESFSTVVKEYTNNGKLVIFVDDLDRCMPENAITVLESLKLFIGDSNCVFVLGMDHLIVEQGLEMRFSQRVKLTGRDYLDKMIQVPFYLPPVPFNQLKTALNEPNSKDIDDSIWKIVELGLGGNPRKTKRFINSFHLANAILKSRTSAHAEHEIGGIELISPAQQKFYVAKLLILQMAFSQFYDHIKENLNDWDTFSTKIVRAVTDTQRKTNLDKSPRLKTFWSEDLRLRAFMDKTEQEPFPQPPKANQLAPLIQAISIVSESYTS